VPSSSSTSILDSLDHYFGPEDAVAAAPSHEKEPVAVAANQPKATGATCADLGQKRKAVGEDSGSTSSRPPPAAKKPRNRLTWDERYEQLKAFKEQFGHTRVPRNGEWSSLHSWFYKNKKCKDGPYRSKPQLTVERIGKLDELGIDWTGSTVVQQPRKYSTYSKPPTWDERFEELKAFKKKYGHTKVPRDGDGSSLYNWLYRNRRCRNGPYNNKPQLTMEQIHKLDELGTDWIGNQVSASGTGHSRWDDKFEQLKAFKMEYGHTEIPPNGDWISLYHWLYNNRRRKISPYQYSPQLTTEQIDKLDELGIDWECKNTYDKSRSIRSALPS